MYQLAYSSRRRRQLIGLMIYVLWGICAIPYAYYLTYISEGETLRVVAGVSVLQSLLLLLLWRVCSGSFFDPYALFFLAATMFNLGHAPLLALGIVPPQVMYEQYAIGSICEAFYLVLLGLYFLGLLGLIYVAVRGNIPTAERPQMESPFRASRQIGGVMCALSAPFMLILMLKLLALSASGGYVGIYDIEKSWGLSLLVLVSGYFVPGALLMLGGASTMRSAVLPLSLIALNAMVYFFIGLRSTAVMPLIAAIWLWHIKIRRIPAVLLFSAAFFALFVVFPTIAVIRDIPAERRSSIGAYIESFSNINDSVSQIFSETGSTIYPVLLVKQETDVSKDFLYGGSYVKGVAKVVVPARYIDLYEEYNSLGEYITDVYNKDGSGLGFSFIAEAFINFGVAGVVLIPAILGYFLASLTWRSVDQKRPLWIIFAALCISYVPFFARGEAMVLFRQIFLNVLLPVYMVKIYTRYSPVALSAAQESKNPRPS